MTALINVLWKSRSICLVLAICGALNACGWHLRGSIALPANIESVYIDNQASRPAFAEDLSILLRGNGVVIHDIRQRGDLVIVLLDTKQDKRVNSVNNNTIVSEYELISQVRYEIKSANGETLLEPSLAQQSRIFTFDRNAVVSATEEERIIQRELRLELAQQIVRRLRFLDTAAIKPTE